MIFDQQSCMVLYWLRQVFPIQKSKKDYIFQGKPGPLCSLGVWAKCLAHPLLSFQDISLLALMCAKLRTYNLLLLLRLSGAYLIIQMGLYLQVNTLLVIYKSRYYSIHEHRCNFVWLGNSINAIVHFLSTFFCTSVETLNALSICHYIFHSCHTSPMKCHVVCPLS